MSCLFCNPNVTWSVTPEPVSTSLLFPGRRGVENRFIKYAPLLGETFFGEKKLTNMLSKLKTRENFFGVFFWPKKKTRRWCEGEIEA